MCLKKSNSCVDYKALNEDRERYGICAPLQHIMAEFKEASD